MNFKKDAVFEILTKKTSKLGTNYDLCEMMLFPFLLHSSQVSLGRVNTFLFFR